MSQCSHSGLDTPVAAVLLKGEMSCLFMPAVHSSVTGSRKSALILTASTAKFSYFPDCGYQSSL